MRSLREPTETKQNQGCGLQLGQYPAQTCKQRQYTLVFFKSPRSQIYFECNFMNYDAVKSYIFLPPAKYRFTVVF